MDQGLPMEPPPDKSYALSGKIMLSAIVILFTVVVVMVCIHLYARWYVIRLRRRRRRATGAVIYLDHDNINPRSIADRGLEPSVLNSLPVFLYATKAVPVECAVCLSEFGENDVVRLLPKCGHTFHVDCIGMWFHSHSTCPLCRSSVEAVVSLADPPAPEAVEEGMSRSEPSSSSEMELCVTCQHEGANSKTTSLWGRRKSIGGGILGIRIEEPTESENGELSHTSSPGTRLLSLKRLFSMTKKTPSGSGGATPTGTSRSDGGGGGGGGGPELDLEGGVSEPARIQTPR